jgi:hypothetical protein
MKSRVFKFLGLVCASALLLQPQFAAAQEQQFATPEEAVQALTIAVAATNRAALDTIFGPELKNLVSADPVQASNRFVRFAQRLSEKVDQVKQSDEKIILDIGRDAWPFPIPLVRRNGQWKFDTDAGREEILNRRIGFNEMGAIAVCHAYVQAQREYASQDRCGDGIIQYAQCLRSHPNTRDGLYWHAEAGEEMSPLGPLIAESHDEGYHKANKILNGEQSPYHGYIYKVLTQQGRHAPGGKYNYIINGHMVAGFALVAWPAEWDNTGVMTFIVNQDGTVYEKNLGPKTVAVARAMTAFDPDATWKRAEAP